MARTSNNGGGENKAAKPPVESKAAKTPARRRSDKTRPAPSAAANDTAANANSRRHFAERRPWRAQSSRRCSAGPTSCYVQRGGIDGHDKEDWFEAERQLRRH